MSISRPNISASASRLLLAAAVALLAATPAAHAQTPPVPAQAPLLLARFLGSWEGTALFSRGGEGEDRTVSATMTGTLQRDGVVLDMALDDGEGRTLRQPFKISVNAAERTLTRDPGERAVTFRILSGTLEPSAGEAVRLVLESPASGQGAPVRETIEIDGPRLVWRREMTPRGAGNTVSSEYRLTRKP